MNSHIGKKFQRYEELHKYYFVCFLNKHWTSVSREALRNAEMNKSKACPQIVYHLSEMTRLMQGKWNATRLPKEVLKEQCENRVACVSERLLRAKVSQGASLKEPPSLERTFQSFTPPSSKLCPLSLSLSLSVPLCLSLSLDIPLFFFLCDTLQHMTIHLLACLTIEVFSPNSKFHKNKEVLFVLVTIISPTFDTVINT